MSDNSTTKMDLKAVKTKLRLKKDEIRQCRLCMRVLPRTDVRDAAAHGSDLRRKILDAVSVKITTYDKVTSACVNCIALVDIIYNFRLSCRKADTLHGTRLLMMHPGSWLSEENKSSLKACNRLVKQNRAEMDALFKCSGLDDGDVSMLIQKEAQEVVLDSKDEPAAVGTEDVSDSDPEMSEECAVRLDQEVQNASARGRQKKFVPTKSKEQMCETCGELVPLPKLKDHTNRHLDHKAYSCPAKGCRKTFFTQSSKKSHVKQVHSAKLLTCSVCSRQLRGAANLRQHMHTHNKEDRSNPRVTRCPICNKIFYKHYLKDHIATHTGELKYGCEICGRRFAAQSNIFIHRKKYHSDELSQPVMEGVDQE